MPRIVRRHWLALVIHCIVIAGVICWLVGAFDHAPPAASAQTAVVDNTAPIDGEVYGCITQLRRELMLGNEDLAAMGCTQAEAEGVLSSVRDWAETNKAQWRQVRQSIRQAEHTLRQTYRKINIGPRDQSVIDQLPDQRRALQTARDARRQLVEAAGQVAAAWLDSAQQAIWATGKANGHLLSRYRYAADLSNEQITELRKAYRRQVTNSAAGTMAETDQRVLNSTQQATMATAQHNAQLSMPGVLAAEQAVLPLPEELNRIELMVPAGSEATQ